jgi:hypothetical protein
MVPLATVVTWQPWCVQVELNALNVPFTGCVTTTWFWSKILPSPTGISSVFPSTAFAGAVCDGVFAGAVCDGVFEGSPYFEQPAAVAPSTTASTARRPGCFMAGPFIE